MRPCSVTAQNGVNSGNSPTVPLDFRQCPVNVGFSCDVTSGTPTFKVQHTYDDVLNSSVTPLWYDNATVTGKTADTDGSYTVPIRGIRCVVTGGTGVVVMTVVQAGQ